MKAIHLALTVVTAAAIVAVSAPTHAQSKKFVKPTGGTAVSINDIPARRSGLWQMIDLDAKPGEQVIAERTCVDQAKERQLHAASKNLLGGLAKCKETQWMKSGNTYYAESTCSIFGMSSTSFTIMTGNPNSEMTIEAVSGDAGSEFVLRQKTIYKGACPANMKPGDVDLGGQIGNVNAYEMLGVK
jgi:hypothetical protein